MKAQIETVPAESSWGIQRRGDVRTVRDLHRNGTITHALTPK